MKLYIIIIIVIVIIIYYYRNLIGYSVFDSIQNYIVKNKKFNIFIPLSNKLRSIFKPYNKIKDKNLDTVLIINGGGFLGDDLFDVTIGNKIEKFYPNANIVTIDYPKTTNFDLVVNNVKNEIINKKYKVIHIYAHSAGCAIAVTLPKFIKIQNITLVSPYLAWTDKIISNKESQYDSINPSLVNIIKNKYNIEIKKYINKDILKSCNIKIVVGKKEVLLQDTLAFCIDMNITNIVILKEKYHGIGSWSLNDVNNSLFNKNISTNNLKLI